MNFHPKKCKVVSIERNPPPLLGILPNIQYIYSLGDNFLDYADTEKDLGVFINSKLNFNEHCCKILLKANQQFGLTKRTCHFVNDAKRRRVLYLALVRGQFEHCSPIWRPSGKTLLDKFEKFQRKCLKWVLGEENLSYRSWAVYVRKCKQADLLPIADRFKLNDLLLLHRVIYNLLPLTLPDYLSFFDGNSRLRSCHLDKLSLVNNLPLSCNNDTYLNKSFFFRTHKIWNTLPLEIRQIGVANVFKEFLTAFLWKLNIGELSEVEDWAGEDSGLSSSDCDN